MFETVPSFVAFVLTLAVAVTCAGELLCWYLDRAYGLD